MNSIRLPAIHSSIPEGGMRRVPEETVEAPGKPPSSALVLEQTAGDWISTLKQSVDFELVAEVVMGCELVVVVTVEV